MGAWGPSLYSDDTTCEVRDEFKALLQDGQSHAAAEMSLLKRFSDVLEDHEIKCLVYFALADTEWKLGCLSDHVKASALELIEAGGDIQGWMEDSPSNVRARESALRALHSRLLSPQPPLKHLKIKSKNPPKKQLKASLGTVFGLALSNGYIALLKFVGLRLGASSEEAVFRLLPWKGQSLPTSMELEKLSDRAVCVGENFEFSLFESDRRKNPTRRLLPTGIVLKASSPLDQSVHAFINIEFIPTLIEHALANE